MTDDAKEKQSVDFEKIGEDLWSEPINDMSFQNLSHLSSWVADQTLRRFISSPHFATVAKQMGYINKEDLKISDTLLMMAIVDSENKEEIAHLEAKNRELREALRGLYEHDADYIRINNLGDINHNQFMKKAISALGVEEKSV